MLYNQLWPCYHSSQDNHSILVTLIIASAHEPEHSTLDSTWLVVTDANDDSHDNSDLQITEMWNEEKEAPS
jgi:hypothetical protein